MSDKITTISVYTSVDLRDFAKNQAKQEGRSVSNYVLQLIERERKRLEQLIERNQHTNSDSIAA
jgi:predicted CopG family antitoxin